MSVQPFVKYSYRHSDGSRSFIICASDRKSLDDIQYNLNPQPHDYVVLRDKGDKNLYGMRITGDQMATILQKFANL